jgi:hypothetical protein
MRPWWVAFVIVLGATAAPVVSASKIVIVVDDDAAPGGNGSARFPYRNLDDAIGAANASSERVLVKVRPGEYVLGAPLLVERPVDLRGSTELIQGDDGWPTGDVVPDTETRIVAASAVGSQSLIVVGRSDANVLDDVSISGFVFQGSANGLELLFNRVQNFDVRANVFRAPALLGLQTVASSGRATGNYFSGVGTGAALTGGYAASPSYVAFRGNRSVRNIFGGLLLNGASINIPELGDALIADVRGNDLSDNTTTASFSSGLRLFLLRRDLGAPGDSQFSARIQALVQGNRIVGNLIGISIDAGFPYRRVGPLCDTRTYSGEIAVRLAGNTLAGNLLTSGLATFTRNTAALDPTMLARWQYLHRATITIADPDGSLADAWIDHPASDPFLGPCPDDVTHEPLENVLIYNGLPVSKGRNF